MDNLLDWQDLRVFAAVLKAGTFSATARDLGIGQATVSRRIAQLEDALHTRLFHRGPEGMTPTDAAERLRPHAEAASQAIEAGAAAMASLDEVPTGRLTLACPVGIATDILGRMMPEIRLRFPTLVLDLHTFGEALPPAGQRASAGVRPAGVAAGTPRA